jgi:hypothetical protein
VPGVSRKPIKGNFSPLGFAHSINSAWEQDWFSSNKHFPGTAVFGSKEVLSTLEGEAEKKNGLKR